MTEGSRTARSTVKGQRHREVYEVWFQSGHSVGFVGNRVSKCGFSAVGKRKSNEVCESFAPYEVPVAVRVIVAVSWFVRRVLRSESFRRFMSVC